MSKGKITKIFIYIFGIFVISFFIFSLVHRTAINEYLEKEVSKDIPNGEFNIIPNSKIINVTEANTLNNFKKLRAVYNKNTGATYLFNNTAKYGNDLIPLLNQDGTPKIYEDIREGEYLFSINSSTKVDLNSRIFEIQDNQNGTKYVVLSNNSTIRDIELSY